MIDMLINYQFMRHAVFASILASIVCGIMGVIIIEKKLVMMSGGIAHTAYGGVGLGYLLGFEPLIGAFIFAIGSALGIGAINRTEKVETDVLIGLFWSFGMACGIFFIALMPSYPPDMTSYLFGNILSVTSSTLRLMIILTVILVFALLAFYEDWKAYLFDETFAKISGVHTNFFHYLLLILVAITAVILIRVAGIILVIALLTAPAATSALFTKSLSKRMTLAVLIGLIYCMMGLWLSLQFNLASGASIVLISVFCFFAAYALKKVSRYFNQVLIKS